MSEKTAEFNMVQKNIKLNIFRNEQDAIQNLRGNSNSVIKEADKGSAVVLTMIITNNAST